MKKKYFGTDGIRGKFGTFSICPDFFAKIGSAVGKVFKTKESSFILLGTDTRESCQELEKSLVEGLMASGINVVLLGVVPTPVVSYLVKHLGANAGLVISASHNPYYDNGLKFFAFTGKKLNLEQELAIEKNIDNFEGLVDTTKGEILDLEEPINSYINFCLDNFKQFNAKGKSFSELKIILDCANGATSYLAPKIYKTLGANVLVINNTPDGININEKCGSTNPNTLIEKVKTEEADLGIAFDGDGDRVIMVDANGSIIDGDSILYILSKYYISLKKNKAEGFNNINFEGVVGTVMSNLALELALKELNVPFVRTKVGDKFISTRLDELGWGLGGEPSGHIICSELSNSGDGIIASIKVIEALLYFNRSLSSVSAEMKKMPQKIKNIVMTKGQAKVIIDSVELRNLLGTIKDKYKNNIRVVIRPSGTEDLLRVMVEGLSEIEVLDTIDSIILTVNKELESLSVQQESF